MMLVQSSIPMEEAPNKQRMNNVVTPDTVYSNQPIDPEDFQSEEKRIRFLAELKNIINQNGGKIGYDDRLGLIDILSQSFCDKLSSSRCTAMDVLCQIIPAYGYELDTHIGMLFPQLLQNLLHRNSVVKKSALQTLHIYFKHSLNKSIILDYLVEYGIKNEQKAIRNEVLMAIPALVRSGFSDNQLKDIFVSVLMTASNIENTESSLPIVLCLQHIKETLGENTFKSFLEGLGRTLTKIYLEITSNSSLVHATSLEDQKRNIPFPNQKDELMFGILPKSIYVKLQKENSWQDRTDAMRKFLSTVTSKDSHADVIAYYCHDLLKYLNELVEDVNFNVSLTALNIIHKVVTRIDEKSRDHLDLILKAFIKKMNDPKIVVKRINLRIALSLMHSLSPSFYIKTILPYLKHKNTCVREETLNTITASLLSFPSSDFDLENLPEKLAFTLIDPKRKIRHSSLECFAVLAQQLGAGRLNPLVTAVNALECKGDGRGVLVAVHARLHRKLLPQLDEDGMVKYALTISTNSRSENTNLEADVLWVISGTVSGLNTPKSKSSQSPVSRRFSAGKKKLPWSTNDDRHNNNNNNINEGYVRKSVGSAPVRQSVDNMRVESPVTKTITHDTWVSGNLNDDTKKENTYFEMYKTRMKKLKQAGLQADATTINSIHPSMGLRNTLPSNMRNVQQFEIAYKKGNINSLTSAGSKPSSPRGTDMLSPLSPVSPDLLDETFDLIDDDSVSVSPKDDVAFTNGTPIPVKATLARSAKKYGRQRSCTDKPMYGNVDSKEKSSLAHTLPKAKGDVLRRLSLQSPFPSRPTIHRSPSGKLVRRPEELEIETYTTNLNTMQKLSTSSPSMSSNAKKNVNGVTSPQSDVLYSNNLSRNYSPVIKTPRAKVLTTPTSPACSPLRNHVKEDLFKTFAEASENYNVLGSIRNDDLTPGQHKMKPVNGRVNNPKEDRLRQSTDSALIFKNRKQKTRLSRSLELSNGFHEELEFSPPHNNVSPNDENIKSVRTNKRSEIPVKSKTSPHIKSKLQNTQPVLNFDDIPIRTKHSAKQLTLLPKDNFDDIPIRTKHSAKQLALPKNDSIIFQDLDTVDGKVMQQKHVDRMKEEERIWKENEGARRLQDDLEKKQEEEELIAFSSSSSTSSVLSHKPLMSHKPTTDLMLNEFELDGSCEKLQTDWCRSLTDIEQPVATVSPEKPPLAHKTKKVVRKTYDVNNNNNDMDTTNEDLDLTVEGIHPPKKSARTAKVQQSPKSKRKTRLSPSDAAEHDASEVQPTKCYSSSGDIDKALEQPHQALVSAMELLASQDENWENKCDGLTLVRRLARHHPDQIVSDFHNIVEAILNEVKNLRSQVTRSALSCIADFFYYLPKPSEVEAEGILKVVLPKAGDTNQFIKSDVELVLKNLSDNIPPVKAFAALSSIGVNHRNPLVRRVCAISLSMISERMEASRLVVIYKDFINVVSKLAIDSQPDARYHGRRILYHIRDVPNLDKMLEKQLQSSNLRPVKDILENLRTKGLPDPPNNGSASVRKSMRNTSSMRSPGTSRRSRPAANEESSPVIKTAPSTATNQESNDKIKKKRRTGTKENGQGGSLNMDCLQKLESTSWSERYEGLDDLYDLVSINPSAVSTNAIKVFDKLCPRLTDSNSKVSLYALQTLNRCVPILRDGMSTAMTIIIENLKTPLSSKNDPIFHMARECVGTITKYIDNTCLVHPLVSAIQYGNARNKPELAQGLADIVRPTFARKPGLINRHVLPTLWSLLSTSSSGAQTPGRANLQSAIANLCDALYECMGEELLEEARNKSSRAVQRLESLLHCN